MCVTSLSLRALVSSNICASHVRHQAVGACSGTKNCLNLSLRHSEVPLGGSPEAWMCMENFNPALRAPSIQWSQISSLWMRSSAKTRNAILTISSTICRIGGFRPHAAESLTLRICWFHLTMALALISPSACPLSTFMPAFSLHSASCRRIFASSVSAAAASGIVSSCSATARSEELLWSSPRVSTPRTGSQGLGCRCTPWHCQTRSAARRAAAEGRDMAPVRYTSKQCRARRGRRGP
mmetsp:Transcript_52065/g.138165  ORF Transcript_52065/g.138165 Transcript_52065/m.138165 type:complete len:238 (+) Transcript_52065:882-1595(+)